MNREPLVRGVRLPRPIRRTLYQLDAAVAGQDMTAQRRYATAIELITLWLQEKTGEVPDLKQALEAGREEVSVSYNGISVHTLCLTEEDRQSWAMRFIHPDDTVPTRLWETQAVVTLEGEEVRLFVENSFSVSVEVEEPAPTVPGFVQAVAERAGLISTLPLTGRPWLLQEPGDIDALYQAITDPRRQMPVVVLSAPDYHKWPLPGYAPDYIISAGEVARRCFGRCFVVQLPYLLGFRWSEKVGRVWSVFDGGVRVYLPELNLDEDDIYTHTLYAKHKILNWRRDCEDLQSYQCFERFLVGELKRTPTVLTSRVDRPTFTALLQKKFEQERQQSDATVEQLRSSYERQLLALGEENEFHKELAEDADQKYRQLEREFDALRNQNYNLEMYIETLRNALANSGKNVEDIIPIPDNYDEMDGWCAQYLSGKLEFTTRARRAVTKDVPPLYDDVNLVYRCLLFLANEYRDAKMGRQSYSIIENKLRELQVENRPAVSDAQAGRYGDEYYHFDANGARHLAEMHLVRGSGRDTRKTLRIYYYWDDRAEKVVVVCLPRHLTTADT